MALFGSVLKGINTDDSDLDLIVISDDFKGKSIFERSKMMMEAEFYLLRKYNIPLDILNMTQEEYQESIDNRRFESQLVF
ncbi:MAG: nucleotidyltransferase domain-containing protein [Bacteroidales bacterium]|nr:nucleotidyltransferase domain-containing protein [Bacteroidales bacterium]